MPLNMSELGLNIIQFISNLYVGVFLWIAGLVSIPCMLEKELYLPTLLYISDELAPRLIQSISCNVRNRNKALKRLCGPRIPQNHNFLKTEKNHPKRKTQKRLIICQNLRYAQRSLIHREALFSGGQRILLIHWEAWFPPSFLRQNQPKTSKTKMFKFETTSFHYFSPRIPNL